MSTVTEVQEKATSSSEGKLIAVGDSSDGKPRWSNQPFDFTLPEDLRRVFPNYRTPDGVSAYVYAREQGIQYPNYAEWKMEPSVEKTGYQDKGALSSPEKSALLKAAKEVIHLTPYCGTEIVGLKLTELTDEQKNDLARLAAERGVVLFRDQDDLYIREQIKFTSYFGEPHIHQQSGIIPDLPWSHIVYKDENSVNGLTSQVWHSDVPYERNSAGLTTMRFDLLPQAENGDFIGGDTLFANGYLIYEALDPKFRAWLETLKTTSNGFGQAAIAARMGMETRRPAFETEHPLVRTNPVTGLKSLYLSENSTQEIVGLEKRLSKAILEYLFDHVRRCLQFQCRIKWTPNAVAVWDNRSHFHTGIFDYFPKTRHGTRVIAQAERPYLDKNSKLYSEVTFQGYTTT